MRAYLIFLVALFGFFGVVFAYISEPGLGITMGLGDIVLICLIANWHSEERKHGTF